MHFSSYDEKFDKFLQKKKKNCLFWLDRTTILNYTSTSVLIRRVWIHPWKEICLLTSGERSLITYPIWRLISYFLFLTEHKPGGEKERNCGSTCRYTRQGALFEARGREQWERLVLILIGSATRLENHECARPVLFLAVEINTFLCPWLFLSLSLSLSISKARYLVCHLFFLLTLCCVLIHPMNYRMRIIVLLTTVSTRSAISSRWPIDKLG